MFENVLLLPEDDCPGASTCSFSGEYVEIFPSRAFCDASVSSLGTAGKAFVVKTAFGVALGVPFKAVATEQFLGVGDSDGKVSLCARGEFVEVGSLSVMTAEVESFVSI